MEQNESYDWQASLAVYESNGTIQPALLAMIRGTFQILLDREDPLPEDLIFLKRLTPVMSDLSALNVLIQSWRKRILIPLVAPQVISFHHFGVHQKSLTISAGRDGLSIYSCAHLRFGMQQNSFVEEKILELVAKDDPTFSDLRIRKINASLSEAKQILALAEDFFVGGGKLSP